MVEAPYVLLREKDRKILFVGDLIPSPLAGFGTTLDKIRKQPDEIQRLVRATLRGIQQTKSNRQESVRLIMKWAEMDQALAEGSYEMAVSSWSNSGAPARKAFRSRWKRSNRAETDTHPTRPEHLNGLRPAVTTPSKVLLVCAKRRITPLPLLLSFRYDPAVIFHFGASL